MLESKVVYTDGEPLTAKMAAYVLRALQPSGKTGTFGMYLIFSVCDNKLQALITYLLLIHISPIFFPYTYI